MTLKLTRGQKRTLAALGEADRMAYLLMQVALRNDLVDVARGGDNLPETIANALSTAYHLAERAQRDLAVVADRAGLDGYDARNVRAALRAAFELGFGQGEER